jgi:hypothetical protein
MHAGAESLRSSNLPVVLAEAQAGGASSGRNELRTKRDHPMYANGRPKVLVHLACLSAAITLLLVTPPSAAAGTNKHTLCTMKLRCVLLFVLAACASAQNVTVFVWNGIPDQKALFYGYLALEGGLPITRGSTLWIPVGKGEFSWSVPTATLSGDFNVDPNLLYDEKHNPSRLLVPRWKTSIHCEATVPNVSTTLGVMFVENPSGCSSKYGCIIQR